MNKYDQLKKVIQSTKPEIMELKFGCEVIYQTLPVPDFKRGIVFQSANKSIGVLHESRIPDFITPERDIWEILGRPIRLADVLLALEHNLRGHSYFVDTQGGLHEWFAPKGQLDLRTVAYWNLFDDNLDHQSEECKEFLINLLVNE